MVKYLLNLIRKRLNVIVIRRYKLTSGNVSELYVDGKCYCDALDTFNADVTAFNVIAKYGDFVQLKPKNVLYVNDKALDGRRLNVSVRNEWVQEC